MKFSKLCVFITQCFHGQAYKHHVLWNILVALGTCGGQLVFSGATFSCPCKAGLNIPYSMATLVVPSLLLFLLGCGLCADTWHLLRACTHGQLSSNTWDIVGSILLSVIGRAIVAPLSWTCISLLTGTMFVCAAAESSDPTQYGFYDLFVTWKSLPEIMAAVPCPDIPLDPALQKAHFPRQAVLLSLHAKSQMYGWLLLGLCSIFIFGVMCVKACRSPRGYLQDVYRHQYRAHETSLFNQTSEQHARALAASNVKRFFGFLATAPPTAPPTALPMAPPMARASGGLSVPGAVIGSVLVDVPELGLIPGEQFEVVSGLMGRCSKPCADRYYSELHYWADNSCSLEK